MVRYLAMLDVPRPLVRYLARLLAAERRVRGTRRGTRALTCFYQALLVLVWFRKADDVALLGAGFGVYRATAYRYLDEGITVLAARAPDLHEALQQVADDGWAFVILDGKLFDCDRLAETTTSVKGETIDAWYSGKHRDFGANIQAVMRPDGLIIWTSAALPGHTHDLSCAQHLGVTAALNWAAAELDLPTLADAGYEGAGHGIKTPAKQPTRGRQLAVANRTVNRLLRGCAGKASEASRSSSAGGNRYVAPPRAHAGSATSSPPRCTSHTSNTNTYPKHTEITSVLTVG